MEESKYAQDGVNVKEGDSFSAFAGELCRQTYANSPYVEVRDFSRGHFRGPRGFLLKSLPSGCWLDVAPDGIGTKVMLINASFGYENASRDWVAMTCGDITRWGGLPLILVNILDTHTLGESLDRTNRAYREMLEGLKRVADEQLLIMYKGETAELGVCVGSENPNALAKFNWAGAALGVYHPSLIITGDTLMPGHVIMALREHSFRSNGISSVRKAFALRFGKKWWSEDEAKAYISRASLPSILYDKFLCEANGWFSEDFRPVVKMHLVTHITGGGIKSKFAEDILFPMGLSARLHNLWEPPSIMRDCADWRGMSDKECYEVWNGGQGALVVIGEDDVDVFFLLARIYNIQARIAGEITKESSPTVTIESKFKGDKVMFSAKG